MLKLTEMNIVRSYIVERGKRASENMVNAPEYAGFFDSVDIRGILDNTDNRFVAFRIGTNVRLKHTEQ